jgi:hypothetical protein
MEVAKYEKRVTLLRASGTAASRGISRLQALDSFSNRQQEHSAIAVSPSSQNYTKAATLLRRLG